MFEREMSVAVDAVRRAGVLCQSVRESLVSEEMVSKMDKSPVTVADFGAQAVIISAIRAVFPNDLIVAEEDTGVLRGDEGAELRSKVLKYVREAESLELRAKSGEGDGEGSGGMSEVEMLEAIDGGQHCGGAKGRFWTLDPIDGTKGYIRGDQYAVALGLIVDGEVVLGVLGCPNLPVAGLDGGDCGVILSASRGEGAFWESGDNDERGTMNDELGSGELGVESGGLRVDGGEMGEDVSGSLKLADWPGTANTTSFGMDATGDCVGGRRRVFVSGEGDPTRAVFCESVESAHTAHGVSADVVKGLGVVVEPARIDSQCKYAVVARGDAGVYMRLPTRADYEEKIWDHAAGVIIVEEAGGMVTDVAGKPLDFSQGRTLCANKGVIVSNGLLHEAVLGEVGKLGKS